MGNLAERAAAELETITHSEERVEELGAQEAVLLKAIGVQALELSIKRREAADRLSAAVEIELADLKMEGARFSVGFAWNKQGDGVPLPSSHLPDFMNADADARFAFDASGIDRVEFLISTNPGEKFTNIERH